MADRDDLEQRIARALSRLLKKQMNEIVQQAEEGDVRIDDEFWTRWRKDMRQVIQPLLIEGYVSGVQASQQQVFFGKAAKQFELDIAEQSAIDWVRAYAFELIGGITNTTRGIVEKALVEFISTEGFTTRDLVRMVEHGFSPGRAETIAVTETTRAYSAGQERVAEQLAGLGLEFDTIWQTSRDELVCPICGPLHKKKLGKDWFSYPPAHPNCRCDTIHVPKT